MTDAKVLLIAGEGRSGSTVLSQVLGGIDTIFAAGEIHHLLDRGIQENQLCGCGKPFHECEVWSKVLETVSGSVNDIHIERLIRAQAKLSRYHYLPQLALRQGISSLQDDLTIYVDFVQKIYKAIADVTGASVIVDSSKYPNYVFMLANFSAVDLYILHLTRDSRAVAYSWQREKQRTEITSHADYMPQRSPALSGRIWLLRNFMVQLAQLTKKPYMHLRYEDMIDQPQQHIEQILHFVGESQPLDVLFKDAPAFHLGANHTVAGNPSRIKSDAVVLKKDTEWQSKMLRRDKFLVTAWTWPLLLKYQYQ